MNTFHHDTAERFDSLLLKLINLNTGDHALNHAALQSGAGCWRSLRCRPLSNLTRAAVPGLRFEWEALAVNTVITSAVPLYSAYSIRRLEKTFADIT
jgi:hypothetical protein